MISPKGADVKVRDTVAPQIFSLRINMFLTAQATYKTN